MVHKEKVAMSKSDTINCKIKLSLTSIFTVRIKKKNP